MLSNGYCRCLSHGGELRLLIDPTKPAGPGDIKVVECETRDIGLPPIRQMRNDYFERWMIEHGHCQLDEH